MLFISNLLSFDEEVLTIEGPVDLWTSSRLREKTAWRDERAVKGIICENLKIQIIVITCENLEIQSNNDNTTQNMLLIDIISL